MPHEYNKKSLTVTSILTSSTVIINELKNYINDDDSQPKIPPNKVAETVVIWCILNAL